MDAELLENLEDYRFENRIPSRSRAIEELIRKGLEDASTAAGAA
jgi:metal-responsive CopG/Arc/MetJ family transcriptional regulator